MSFKYKEAVPWGRSFEEYQRIFCLTDEELNGKVLGCADGPASFNAGMAARAHRVISCDPLYQLTAEEIRQRIDVTYEDVMKQARRNQHQFVWDTIKSVEDLGQARMAAMKNFLADYEAGKKDGRYIAAQLPNLPFATAAFDLALCSHFLFFYSDNLSEEFHATAMDELCRVAREVRIFPLLTYNAEPCAFVEPIVRRMKKAGHSVSIERVPYEFQRGGNQMLRVRRT